MTKEISIISLKNIRLRGGARDITSFISLLTWFLWRFIFETAAIQWRVEFYVITKVTWRLDPRADSLTVVCYFGAPLLTPQSPPKKVGWFLSKLLFMTCMDVARVKLQTNNSRHSISTSKILKIYCLIFNIFFITCI